MILTPSTHYVDWRMCTFHKSNPTKRFQRSTLKFQHLLITASFYDLLGSVMLTKKDYSGAETALRKAVQLNKNNVDAYVKLGQSQLARGATNETLATYAEATAANPKDPGLYI